MLCVLFCFGYKNEQVNHKSPVTGDSVVTARPHVEMNQGTFRNAEEGSRAFENKEARQNEFLKDFYFSAAVTFGY